MLPSKRNRIIKHIILIVSFVMLSSLRIFHYWFHYLFTGKDVSERFVNNYLFVLKIINIIDYVPVTIMEYLGILYPGHVTHSNIHTDIHVSIHYFLISFIFWSITFYLVKGIVGRIRQRLKEDSIKPPVRSK